MLLLRTLKLGAGGWRCTLKRWVLLWSLLGPSAVAAGTFSISGFVFITPASGTEGAWLWCSEAPVHFPVTGKGAARTRGLCGVSRPDKHCLAPWGSAGPPQQQLPRPSHPRGGTLPPDNALFNKHLTVFNFIGKFKFSFAFGKKFLPRFFRLL